MIVTAYSASTKAKVKLSRHEDFFSDVNDGDSESYSTTDDEVDASCTADEEQDKEDEIATMKSTWKRLSPPNTEASLIGKWFGVCYKGRLIFR